MTLSLKGVKSLPAADQGFYKMKITEVEDTLSTNHNPMLKMKVVAEEILYPISVCLTYHDKKQIRRLRQFAECVVASNPDKLTMEDLEAEALDYKKLEGLEVGAYLRFADESHRYLEVGNFCPLKDVE